jgi:uncharacterized protein YdaU (DUF1376 family)
MYYYQHHIGDYRKDTSHLSLLEHGIYRQLLDLYYINEQPLSTDHAITMRLICVRNADESKAYENVINDFFQEKEDGFYHKRCEDEIVKFHGKSEKSREAANKRWSNNAKDMRSQCGRNADGMPTNNQEPITNNQEPIKEHKARAPKYDFVKSLVELGADEKSIRDWLEVRKKKRAANTESSIDHLVRESAKANISIADAVLICATRNWQNLTAEWLQPKIQHQSRPEKFNPTAYVNRNRNVLKEIE